MRYVQPTAHQRRRSQLRGSTGLPLLRSSKYRAGRPWPPELPTVAIGSPARTQSPPSLSRASLLAYRLIQPSPWRSEEHTSELQSLMRISYAVFCLKKKKHTHRHKSTIVTHMIN